MNDALRPGGQVYEGPGSSYRGNDRIIIRNLSCGLGFILDATLILIESQLPIESCSIRQPGTPGA
jgi:hypothetical protein